jgi:hypothetical protein
MNRHRTISIIVILVLLVIPAVTYAAVLTKSFGGKVQSTQITDVDCYGAGTGPLIISMVSGIPLYATSILNAPRVGDWILGTTSVIPSFGTCYTQVGPYQVPFPVRTTSHYGVSSGSFF